MGVRKAYQSDLSDAQWEVIAPQISLPAGGRPRTTDLREVFNGIYYQLKTGCQWKNLPHDLPPEGTVRRYFHYLRRTHQIEKVNDALRNAVRVKAGRNEEPSLAIIDSQSVKSTRTSGERGFDAGKKNQWH
jgi:putative transposase